MALLRAKELRELSQDERDERMKRLKADLMHERGVAAMGGAPASPGKIKAIRKNIARINTINGEVKE